jgi:hypothetical protein
MTASYIGRALVVRGSCPKPNATAAGQNVWEFTAANRVLGFSFLHLECCSLCNWRRERSFRRASCRQRYGCESGCLCALAPHGASNCLPRHAPQSIALFSVASGWFRSQSRRCERRPGAIGAKGGQGCPSTGSTRCQHFTDSITQRHRLRPPHLRQVN